MYSGHLSLLVRRGIHSVFALDGNNATSISIQFYLQVCQRYFCRQITETLRITWARFILSFFNIKDTKESNTFTYYLHLLLSIGSDGKLHTDGIYVKRDNNQFPYNVLVFAELQFFVYPGL